MDATLKSLRNELSSILKINFRGIHSGYECIELAIVQSGKHLSFTHEQWKAVVSNKFDNLFQHGTPHVSWNTYRSTIFQDIERQCPHFNTQVVKRTWHKETTTVYMTPGGVCLKLIKNEPYYSYDAFGYHPTEYRITVLD